LAVSLRLPFPSFFFLFPELFCLKRFAWQRVLPFNLAPSVSSSLFFFSHRVTFRTGELSPARTWNSVTLFFPLERGLLFMPHSALIPPSQGKKGFLLGGRRPSFERGPLFSFYGEAWTFSPSPYGQPWAIAALSFFNVYFRERHVAVFFFTDEHMADYFFLRFRWFPP